MANNFVLLASSSPIAGPSRLKRIAETLVQLSGTTPTVPGMCFSLVFH